MRLSRLLAEVDNLVTKIKLSYLYLFQAERSIDRLVNFGTSSKYINVLYRHSIKDTPTIYGNVNVS
jgi:hypothetical protein